MGLHCTQRLWKTISDLEKKVNNTPKVALKNIDKEKKDNKEPKKTVA